MSRLLLILILFSCSRNETQKIQESYEGPIIEIKDLNTFFSDSAKVRFKLKSELYLVFTSGEVIYPDGLKMDIYSKSSDTISAIFSANHVIKFEDENYYKATGDVLTAGTSEFSWISGTGPWSELVGVKCLGALVQLGEEHYIWKGKCNVSEKTFERFSNFTE